MNGKIALAVSTGFVIVFSLLITLSFLFPEPSSTNHPFYNQKFNEDSKKIFFLGSSHVGRLNNTLVSEYVDDYKNIEIFNLAYGLDTPNERINTIEKIISLKPKIVFYGVSYRDFADIKSEKNLLPNLNQIKFKELEDNTFNPKINSLKLIRNSFAELGFRSIVEKTTLEINTPFSTMQKGDMTVASIEELERISERFRFPQIQKSNISENDQINNFKTIIEKLQKNNIKIIVFTTPLSSIYLESLSSETKINFEFILNKIKEEYNLEIYDFTKKYSNSLMWTNLDHISYNSDGMVYSKDVADILKREIEK